MFIKKPIKTGINLLFVMTALCVPAVAFSAADPEDGKIKAAFCPALADQESYNQSDLDHYAMLIPGNEGWIFRTENDFRSHWKNSPASIVQLQELQKAFKKNNAELVIVMPPVRGLVHAEHLSPEDDKKHNPGSSKAIWKAYEESIEDLKKNSLNIVGVGRNEVSPGFYYKRNHHWSPEGARITAKKTADAIKALSSYKNIPKIEYVTTKKEPIEYDSSFERAFKEICKTEVAPETAAVYETAPKAAANDKTALLGDNKEPQIVLLGTSNSVPDASTANFEGFLKEFLSADIMNLSIMGAGIDASIISYLNSDHFRSPAPKIVIWEMPGYYYFDEMQDKLFAQLIPGAYGSCGEAAVLTKDVKLAGDETVLFDAEHEKPEFFATANYEDLYVHLDFPQPVKKKLALKFGYNDGLTKKIQFQRPARYPHDGEFFTAFPKKGGGVYLNKIKLANPADLAGKQVKAEICKLL